MKRVLVISTLCCLFILKTTGAQANEAKQGITVDPAFIEIDLEEDEQEETFEFGFQNNNKESVIIELFTLNFRHKDETGLVQFIGDDTTSYEYSLVSYISVPVDSIRVAPGEKEVVPVTVKNRLDLSPGGHYAGIIGRITSDKDTAQNTKVRPSVASLILLRKRGGEQFNLSLKEVDWPSRIVHFFYTDKISLMFQNEGNIHLVPRGTVEIRDILGRVIYKGVINTSSFYVLPSSKRRLTITMNKTLRALPISIDTLTVKGNDSLKKTRFTFQDSYIHIHPIVIFILIVASGLTFAYSKRKWSKR